MYRRLILDLTVTCLRAQCNIILFLYTVKSWGRREVSSSVTRKEQKLILSTKYDILQRVIVTVRNNYKTKNY